MIEIQVFPNSTVVKGPGGVGFFYPSGDVFELQVNTPRGTYAQQIGTADEALAIIKGQVH